MKGSEYKYDGRNIQLDLTSIYQVLASVTYQGIFWGDGKDHPKHSSCSKERYTLGGGTIHIYSYFKKKRGECYNGNCNSLYL